MNTNTIIRGFIGLFICIMLFIIHSVSMVFVFWLVDNIIYYGEIKQKIFGFFAIFFGPIISFFVCSYVYFLFSHKKSIYVFMLIVPIFIFFTMKITKNKIIDYFNIPEDLGIAEIIDITIAILLYVVTKILIEKLILKDEN
ncbi:MULTISPECIES: hypothetical protein [unclassified Campylobacter]|uniref:hypothetical protein n=1 Tax=unclassified Campylobacter TaxID=2593542 RepID=UPI0022E9AAB1|nr:MULTISPECIES: hypothetical protein [unclassified Campylobacter]MDA3053898.1 hypothetical protein [Campylobacter sp. VBCF_07 NA4]MDA3069729.1 hypothetical protein [Campylobacter sp. VBCF_08 NA3]WBR54940.1 hypothetical protein PF027_03450 [Campylobacter sp. VBCF_01 NA2]